MKEQLWEHFQKKLEDGYVREWVSSNLDRGRWGVEVTQDVEAHAVNMIEGLMAGLCDKRPIGDFLKAVLLNDLSETYKRADSVNEKIVPLYLMWLYWEVPFGLVQEYRKLRHLLDD